MRLVTFSFLNIRVEKHDKKNTYEDVFNILVEKKFTKLIRGKKTRLLGKPIIYLRRRFFQGLVFRYMEIDKNSPWFNEITEEAISTEDIEGLNIPNHVKPNLKMFPFLFDLQSHVLIYESKNQHGQLSPSTLEIFFQEALVQPIIVSKFGQGHCNILSSRKTLDRIFEMDKIKKLKLVIERPNAFGEELKAFMEDMQETQTGKIVLEHHASKGSSIEKNDKLLMKSRIAQKNGYVRSEGTHKGKKEIRSSNKYPLSETKKIDTKHANNEIFEILWEKSMKEEWESSD